MAVKTRTDLSADRLRELLHYDPDTGIFTWNQRAGISAARWSGRIAGSNGTGSQGRPYIRIEGVLRLCNRLAWLYMTGAWPALQVDHKNRNPRDNRWSNLREATCAQNTANTKVRTTNTSGFKGASYCRVMKSWKAQIHISGKKIYLGCFPTPEEAHAVYMAAARAEWGDFVVAA